MAASPSIWYHNFYLNQVPAPLAALHQNDSIRLFLSVGGLENPQWDIKPVQALRASIRKTNLVALEGRIYNQLGHMDTGQLSFLKGLQSFYHYLRKVHYSCPFARQAQQYTFLLLLCNKSYIMR